MIKIYMPVHNSASFLEAADVPPQFEVTVVDAASTDSSASVAESRGWTVARRTQKTGRVENWEYAVKHFIHSQSAWCKWLFTGDRLYPQAHDLITTAILNAPQAKLIICEYDIVADKKQSRWKMFPETRLLSPPETLWLTAKLGNWFGSPIGQSFHRDAVSDSFSFGPWVWGADMQFCYNIAKQWPVLYVAESIGEFHAESRKTFSSHSNALSSSVEEHLIRTQAARDYLYATEDSAAYEELCKAIVQETESAIINRAFNRMRLQADVQHIFKAMPLSQLGLGLGQRLLDKIKGL